MPERDGYIPGVPCWINTSTPDPEAAVDFYRGLFGWEFENVMPEGSEGKYFIARIRGGDVAAVGPAPADGPPAAAWNTYVWVDSADDTAAKVQAAGGSVLMEAFEDVVASLNPLAAEEADAPAHWSVTFAVDDADGTAEKVFELGGQVTVPPFDAPWVLMTVITDPQGATFIASKFVPENRGIA